MNQELEIQKLKKAGYDPVYVWKAESNEEDSDHTHPFHTHLTVLEGSIEIEMNGSKITLKSGNGIDIPKQKIHSGKVGKDGCTYIVGEKHNES